MVRMVCRLCNASLPFSLPLLAKFAKEAVDHERMVHPEEWAKMLKGEPVPSIWRRVKG